MGDQGLVILSLLDFNMREIIDMTEVDLFGEFASLKVDLSIAQRKMLDKYDALIKAGAIDITGCSTDDTLAMSELAIAVDRITAQAAAAAIVCKLEGAL